jgi:hypothetical protein
MYKRGLLSRLPVVLGAAGDYELWSLYSVTSLNLKEEEDLKKVGIIVQLHVLFVS